MLDNNIIKLIENINVIDKKIIIPFSKKELLSQHKYIDYLDKNGINVAKVYNIFKVDNYYHEHQEYISNSSKAININSIIKSISKYHETSRNYNNILYKKNRYHFQFECRNVLLNDLLLGYKEKYHIYPIKNYNINKHFINKSVLLKSNEIIKQYNSSYKYIINHHDINSCIIHNDITINNILFHNKRLYLIDFDLCYKSLELVDLVDAITIKYNSFSKLIDLVKNNEKELLKCINSYNKYNSKKFNIIDIYHQIILKLVSFNYYVLLNNKTKKIFNRNIKELYVLIEEIKRKLS